MKLLYFCSTRKIPRVVCAAAAALTVGTLVGVFLFLLFPTMQFFTAVSPREFFLGTEWNPTSYHKASWGVLSLVSGTLFITILSLAIVVPFGLAIAVYLSQIAQTRVREILKPLLELIASIPSVILGLLGLLFVAPMVAAIFHLSNGLTALTAALLVALATLPTVASISEDALSSVPKSLREASLALGATEWITIRSIIIPAARHSLVAATMLGLGRIIGETMIVLMVAGNVRAFPMSFLDPVRPMTASIAIEIKEVVVGSLHWQGLFAIGFSLLAVTFFVNLLADTFVHRARRQ